MPRLINRRQSLDRLARQWLTTGSWSFTDPSGVVASITEDENKTVITPSGAAGVAVWARPLVDAYGRSMASAQSIYADLYVEDVNFATYKSFGELGIGLAESTSLATGKWVVAQQQSRGVSLAGLQVMDQGGSDVNSAANQSRIHFPFLVSAGNLPTAMYAFGYTDGTTLAGNRGRFVASATIAPTHLVVRYNPQSSTTPWHCRIAARVIPQFGEIEADG